MALSVEDVRNMPLMWKILLGVLGLLLVLYFYYFYFLQPLLDRQESLGVERDTLEARVAEKEKLLGEMDRYRKGIEELKKEFAVVIQKLPEQKEIPGLMTAISTAGRSEGLEFLLLEPLPPATREFYAEIPVKITVRGKYTEIWNFFDKVAALSRVVNVTDFAISRGREDTGGGLTASCLINTYMFVETKDGEEEKREGQT